MKKFLFCSTSSIVFSIPSMRKVYEKVSIFFQFLVYLTSAKSIKNFNFFSTSSIAFTILSISKVYEKFSIVFSPNSILFSIPSISKVYEKFSISFQPGGLLLVYLGSAKSIKFSLSLNQFNGF